MKTAGSRGRHGDHLRELDSGPVVALLLFEAAGCLMALPASEVTSPATGVTVAPATSSSVFVTDTSAAFMPE